MTRIVATLLTMVVTLGAVAGMVALRPSEARPPYVFGTEGQRYLTRRVLARFESAGLELPPGVEIHFACTTPQAGFTRRDPHRWYVEICEDEEWVVAHELAHVWVQASTSSEERRELLAHVGLAEWVDDADAATPWTERGSEQAAETLRWGIYHGMVESPFGQFDVAEANRGYRILSGKDAPHCRHLPCAW